jgi:hypothetical protein
MKLAPRIQARFNELEEAVSQVQIVKSQDWMDYVESET